MKKLLFTIKLAAIIPFLLLFVSVGASAAILDASGNPVPTPKPAASSSAAKTQAQAVDCGDTGDAATDEVLAGVGTVGGDCSGTGFAKIIKSIINILSLLVGAVAVIMVIISGFKYITTSGDAGKVASAKNTLMYALVGVAIAALAQVMVHFVINEVGK